MYLTIPHVHVPIEFCLLPPPVHSSLYKKGIGEGGGGGDPDLLTGRFFAHPAYRKQFFT